MPIKTKDIGRLVRISGCYQVCCAACGIAKNTPPISDDHATVAESLRRMGWRDNIDGRWRCDACTEHQATKHPES